MHMLIKESFSAAIAIHANEHMKIGSIARIFRLLGLADLITTITLYALPSTCIRGSNQIDKI